MASTILLDRSTWDIVLDANGNIAAADEPYALAQDASSAIKTFLGECYLDTTVGIPYLTQVFGQLLATTLLKALLIAAAETVPDVASAQVFFTSANTRAIGGQVQTTTADGQPATAPFTVINPQGTG